MMFNKRLFSGAFALALVSVLSVSAAQTIEVRSEDSTVLGELETRFKAADKNGDGKLTHEEAKEGMPRVADAFNHIDAEKKGFVTLEQLKAVIIKSGGG